MQIGKHYSITIRGTEYFTVCVGADDYATYLKDINNNLLVIPYDDKMAFSTVGETFRYQKELGEINKREADKEFDVILKEALNAKKLISADTPLQMLNGFSNIDQSMVYLQNIGNSLKKIEQLLDTEKRQFQIEEEHQKEREQQISQDIYKNVMVMR